MAASAMPGDWLQVGEGPGDWLHKDTCAAVVRALREDSAGLYGRYLAIGTTGVDPAGKLPASLRNAAPDQADPGQLAAVEGGGGGE